jgi:hypothetical protein
MEDHMYGVGRESVEEKTARLARKAGANILAFDKRVGISATVTAAAVTAAAKVKEAMPKPKPRDPNDPAPDPDAPPEKPSAMANVQQEMQNVNDRMLKPAAEATAKAATDTWNTVSSAVGGLFAKKDASDPVPAVPPPSAVMGQSAVGDDVDGVETKTIEEVVANTNGSSSETNGGGEIKEDPPASPVPTSANPST